MSKTDKRRKWILSLGFSEAEADSFIEFEVPKEKIEALAEVLYPKPTPPTEEPADEGTVHIQAGGPDEGQPGHTDTPEEHTGGAEEPGGDQAFGDYLCPECKVTHKASSKIHKQHLKLLKAKE